ncbi:hypothetical protein JCM11251_000134 [Rhodosporidiobolus azoricus]
MANKTSTRRRSNAHGDDDNSDSGEGTDYDAAPAATAKKGANGKAKKKSSGGASQKKRKAAARDSSDDEMDVDLSDEDDESGGAKQGKKGELTDDEKKHYIQLFVRYVLFHESHERRPLKREDVVKNVLTDGRGRHFNTLFVRVQKVLKEVMGMELVALRAKEGGKTQTKQWVLCSLLPPPLIRHSTTHPLPSLASTSSHPSTSASAGGKKRTIESSLAAFEADEELLPGDAEAVDEGVEASVMRDVKREEGAAYGVLGVILALILVNGKVLADDQLISYLRRLSLYPSSPIPFSIAHPSPSITSTSSSSSASNHTTLSGFLNLLVKQSYLERGKTGNAAGGAGGTQGGATQGRGGGGGRTQGPSRTQRRDADGGGGGGGVTENGDPSVEWRWGARSEVEFGELGVAKFVERIFHASSASSGQRGEGDEGGEGGEGGGGGGKRGKTGERFLTEVARAAGVKELRGADEAARAADE